MSSLGTRLAAAPPDPLLALIRAFQTDARAHKIDLGVGVLRDVSGGTPVFAAIKAAETQILHDQGTKAYLGIAGNSGFLAALGRMIAESTGMVEPEPRGVQTPGGTGALRLALDLVKRAKPGARIVLGTPSWPNHPAIIAEIRLSPLPYRHADPATGLFDRAALGEAMAKADEGDALLIQASCHNPTGVPVPRTAWSDIGREAAGRGVVVILDLAYQGLGHGLDVDAVALADLRAAGCEVLLAYSCDKNFGLYRERTGALFVLGLGPGATELAIANLESIARCSYSMPPDHGAEAVRIVLENPGLRSLWLEELERARLHIQAQRYSLSACHPSLRSMRDHEGLFEILPLGPGAIDQLRGEDAIYMAGSGRINVTGLTDRALDVIAAAIDRQGPFR
jgi:aromatic-amino-acid transaminase